MATMRVMLTADALDARLTEWSKWARSTGRHRARCGSLERPVRSPQRNHWEVPVQTIAAPVVAQRAYAVE